MIINKKSGYIKKVFSGEFIFVIQSAARKVMAVDMGVLFPVVLEGYWNATQPSINVFHIV